MAENAELEARLLAQAREVKDGQRMAREIHDTLAQGLTGIITQVQAARAPMAGPPISAATSTTPPPGP